MKNTTNLVSKAISSNVGTKYSNSDEMVSKMEGPSKTITSVIRIFTTNKQVLDVLKPTTSINSPFNDELQYFIQSLQSSPNILSQNMPSISHRMVVSHDAILHIRTAQYLLR